MPRKLEASKPARVVSERAMTLSPLRRTFQLLGFAGLLVVSLLGVSNVPEARADLATISGQALDVKANKLELAYDEAPQVKWARGTGGVEARVQGVVARAAVVEVDVAKRKVDLSGGVRLTRGQGWVEAERASIDISTYRVSLHEVKGSIPVKP